MSRKRILLITTTITNILDSIDELSKRHDLHVIYNYQIYVKKIPHNHNVKYYRLKPPENLYSFTETKSILDYLRLIPLFLYELVLIARIITGEKIDVVNAHWVIPSGFLALICTLLLGKLNGINIPVIVTARGSDLKVFNEKKLYKPLIEKTLNNASKVICVSHDLKNITLQMGVKEQDVVFIPPGVNLDEFKPRDKHELRRELCIALDTFVAIFVGNLKQIKNVYTLIDVIKQVSETQKILLLIIGDGPEKEKLIKKVEYLNMGNVIFHGSTSHTEMPKYLSASDILILPSQSEGLPLCIQEAMACGTPVIANDVGGVSWLLQNGENGILTNDESEIYSALSNVLSDPSLLDKYQRNSLSFARRHLSHIPVTSRIEDVLLQCLA